MALSTRRTALIYVALWLGDGVKPRLVASTAQVAGWLVFHTCPIHFLPYAALHGSCCRGGVEVASNVARPRLLVGSPTSDSSSRVGFVPDVTSSDKVACWHNVRTQDCLF